MIDAEIDAVQAAPNQEIPAGAMPQPAEQHRHQQVDIAPLLTKPIARTPPARAGANPLERWKGRAPCRRSSMNCRSKQYRSI
jgi:hypothetical protein